MAGPGQIVAEGTERAVEQQLAANQRANLLDRESLAKNLLASGMEPSEIEAHLRRLSSASTGLGRIGSDVKAGIGMLLHRPAPRAAEPVSWAGESPLWKQRANSLAAAFSAEAPVREAEQRAENAARLQNAEAEDAWKLAHPASGPGHTFTYMGADGKPHLGTLRNGVQYDDENKSFRTPATIYEKPPAPHVPNLAAQYAAVLEKQSKGIPLDANDKAIIAAENRIRQEKVQDTIAGNAGRYNAMGAALGRERALQVVSNAKTALGELDNISHLIGSLGNTSNTWENYIRNKGKSIGGNPAPTTFDTARRNLDTALSHLPGYDPEMDSVLGAINLNMSPEQLKGAVAQIKQFVSNVEKNYASTAQGIGTGSFGETNPAPAPRMQPAPGLNPAQQAARDALLGGG